VSSRPIPTATGPLQVSMSIGLLLSNDWGVRPVEELLYEVDAALYVAKAAGRNCVRRARPGVPTSEPNVAADEAFTVALNQVALVFGPSGPTGTHRGTGAWSSFLRQAPGACKCPQCSKTSVGS